MSSIIISKHDRDFVWTDEMVQNARRFVQIQQVVAAKLHKKEKAKEKSEGL